MKKGCFWVFVFSLLILGMVQWKVERPMLLAERFIDGAGWVEAVLLAILGGFFYHLMEDSSQTKKWRTISWTVFSVIFFSQLILGLLGFEKFLMSGDLHLPVPGIILGGAVYRMEFSFMPILFLSTLLLTGPAWCSQLCYLGAVDYHASKIKKRPGNLVRLMVWRNFFLLLFIIGVLILRALDTDLLTAAWAGGIFGITGVVAIIVLSSAKGTMVHCTLYCPLGTLVSFGKYISPFRMYIDTNCDECMKCTLQCRYGALQKRHIMNKKPGLSCTYCGDCISSCHTNSIKYRFFKLSPDLSRKLYLGTVIVLFMAFLAFARI